MFSWLTLGKVASALYPLEGTARIAAFFAGVTRKVREGVRVEFSEISGQQAVVLRIEDRLDTRLIFETGGKQHLISRVYAVRNPDKLAGVAVHLGLKRSLTMEEKRKQARSSVSD